MKHTLNFSKYHGLGNDFIVIDGFNQRLEGLPIGELASKLCDRHFGIGADGIILCLPSTQSDAKMIIYNSDGSEPENCGNGVRCCARFLYDRNLVEKDIFSLELKNSVVVPGIIKKDDTVAAIEVDMGVPDTDYSSFILDDLGASPVLNHEISLDNGYVFSAAFISMGNPHTIIFVDNIHDFPITDIGPRIEALPIFKDRTNVEFATIKSKTEVILKVWERGVGETLACGTGACATVAAGILSGRLDHTVHVHLPGGELIINWQDTANKIIMTGPAHHVYDGQFNIS